MKKIILFIVLFSLFSCSRPVLNKWEFNVIDTVSVSYNGFNMTLGYNVIVMLKDSSLHFGYINSGGELSQVNPKPILKLKLAK